MAAIIAGELAALAADARTLAARLAPGAIVDAVVLPSNGLTDLLDVGGLRVAADLPPNLRPGEAITVRVVDLDGDRINLHVIGKVDHGAELSMPPAPLVPTATVHRPLPVSPLPAPGPPAPPARASKPVEIALEARLAASHAMPLSAVRPHAPTAETPRPPMVSRVAAPPLQTQSAPDAGSSPRFADPATLLRALRLPVTATNVALARIALDAPDKLPGALAVLERALSAAGDPHVGALVALSAFVGRLDPRSPVLAAQIEAYADHVVTGSEAKLAQLFGLRSAPSGDAAILPAPSDESVAAGRTALAFDFKTRLLALAADRAALDVQTPKALSIDRAIAGALTAVTVAQLNAAAALANEPETLAFDLPLALPEGFAHARIRIGRDKRDGKPGPLDGDTFTLSVVLETRELGTIGIDLATVRRFVTIGVKTENARAARLMSAALSGLTARLESLRYGVASSHVAVAPDPGDDESHVAAIPAKSDAPQLVDVDA